MYIPIISSVGTGTAHFTDWGHAEYFLLYGICNMSTITKVHLVKIFLNKLENANYQSFNHKSSPWTNSPPVVQRMLNLFYFRIFNMPSINLSTTKPYLVNTLSASGAAHVAGGHESDAEYYLFLFVRIPLHANNQYFNHKTLPCKYTLRTWCSAFYRGAMSQQQNIIYSFLYGSLNNQHANNQYFNHKTLPCKYTLRTWCSACCREPWVGCRRFYFAALSIWGSWTDQSPADSIYWAPFSRTFLRFK
jgi:hypothetical protein